MEYIEKGLQSFANVQVEISIQDKKGEKTPFIQKQIKKVAINSEHTHILLYFDHSSHISVPLTCEVTNTDDYWEAYDRTADLHYIIRRVVEKNDNQ